LLVYKLYFFKNVYSPDEVSEAAEEGGSVIEVNDTSSDNPDEQILNTTNITSVPNDTDVTNVTAENDTSLLFLLF
jgi:hypothetical protein